MIIERQDSGSPLSGSGIDPITLTVIMNRLDAIAVEMATVLERSAFSPILSLCRDYSCCVYDASARQVAMVDGIPIHTNSMDLVIKEIARRFKGDIKPGDVVACNDPYSGNTHVGDLVTVCPVFHDSRLIFWAVAKGHQIDVGAPVPTSVHFAAENTWQEGLIIPPVKFYDGGTPRRDVINLYLSNLRWRGILEADLMAQIGAIWIGAQRLGAVCERYGAGDVEQCLEKAIDYGSRRTADEITSMASGRYMAEGWMDSDGHRLDVEIRCTVTIDDEYVDVDFGGSAKQAKSGTNASLADMQAGGGIPIMLMIDPDIPHNEGCIRRVRVTAPKGSICNAEYPASTAMGTTQPTDVMQEVVCKAFIKVAPQRVPAGSSHLSHMAMLSGMDARSSTHWGHLVLNIGGGGGAAYGADGWPLNATCAARGGLKTASVEHTELLYPVLVEEWEIEPNSMGLGEYIGGSGVRFSLQPLYGPMENIYNSDGLRNPPFGALGATPGAGGGSYIEEHSTMQRRFLPAEVHVEVSPDESWAGISSGGGGYGNPLDRPIEQVCKDVRDGLYTAERAHEIYGVVLVGELDPVIDEPATEEARRLIARLQKDEGVPLTLPNRPGASTWLEDNMRPGDVLADRYGRKT